MKRFHVLFIATVLASSVFGANKDILCDEPQGTRVDYFSLNNANLQNQTFIVAPDRAMNMRPKVTLDDNKEDVVFTLSEANDTDARADPEKTAHMKVVHSTDDQITFSGLLNGAPVMATYYPLLNILIYTQQSMWPGPDYQGAKAIMFYAKCKNST